MNLSQYIERVETIHELSPLSDGLHRTGVRRYLGLFLLSLLCSFSLHSQSWQLYPELQSYDFAKDAVTTPDGGYLIAGHTGPDDNLHDVFLIKLDPFGKEQWRRSYGGPSYDAVDDLLALPDGTFIMAGATFSFGNGGSDLYLIKVDQRGEVIWEKTIGTTAFEFGRNIIQTSDGGFAIAGRFDDGNDAGVMVIKTDVNGEEVWTNIYGGMAEDEAWFITETADNQLVVVGSTRSFGMGERDVYLISIGLDESFNWVKTYGGTDDELGTCIINTSDGGLLIGAATKSFGAGDYDIYLLKTDTQGDTTWTATYGGIEGEWGAYLAEFPNGDFALAGSTKSFGNVGDDIYLLRTQNDGTPIWQRSFGQDRLDIPHSLELTPDGGMLVAGHARVDQPAPSSIIETSQSYVIRTSAAGVALSNYFSGKIFDDTSTDCLFQDGERGFANWSVTARNENGTTYYGLTNAAGQYSILVDTGQYTLTLNPPNTYWQPCDNNVFIGHSNLFDTLMVDFPLKRDTLCAQLEIDIATTVVRPCKIATYQVRYCNHGTITATDILIDINGQTFSVNDLPAGECASFPYTIPIDCDFDWGRSFCIEASISPNEICKPTDPQWDGSSIDLSAECKGDSVAFKIKNTGGGGMSEPVGFIIIEDQIMPRALNIQLGIGDSTVITHPANGKMIRLQMEHPIQGHPGKSRPSIFVEGCSTSDPISKGFVTVWEEDDRNPFESIDCRESFYNIPADDKLAFPKGIGNQHLIQPETDIEYFIHFQNTGESTISTVVIEDTLSNWLDVTSVRPGAGSHPFRLEVSNTGILQFTFENIALPDSTSNEAASHGFVKFRVSQLPNAPAGSMILNRSCVFFDYGEPVAKPRYYHTLNEPQVFSISDVSLCTGGIVEGVAISGDTSLFDLIEVPSTDSLFFTNVTAWPVYDMMQEATTCANDIYDFFGQLLDTPGVYDAQLSTINGCDSLITLDLAHLAVPEISFQDTTCENEPYFFNGETIDEPGVYEAVLTTTYGCDSLVTLDLAIDSLNSLAIDTAIAVGSEFMGILLQNDTTLTELVMGEMGCDTLLTWIVDVFTDTHSTQLLPPSALSITPNPFTKKLTLQSRSPIAAVEIRSALGAVVIQKKFTAGRLYEMEMTVGDLPAGAYFVLVKTEEGVAFRKLMKVD